MRRVGLILAVATRVEINQWTRRHRGRREITRVRVAAAVDRYYSMGSGGFEKVLIGTRGARETFLRGRKGRAAKNSVLTSGVKQLKC